MLARRKTISTLHKFLLKNELENKTWSEVQAKLMDVQQDIQMCIYKNELNPLGM